MRRLGAVAVLVLVAARCGGGEDEPARPAAPLEVRTSERTFVDEARQRTLRTVVTRPARGGPYPLLVLSHGLGARPEMWGDFAETMASRGWVVAAPEFPVTTSGSWDDALDVNNQPADVSFVIDRVLALPALRGAVDRGRMAAAGHSLGGITTMMLGFHPCCDDERLDAAVVWAGAAIFGTGEGRWFEGLDDPPPVLLVHGEGDSLVRHVLGRGAYRRAPEPKHFLSLPEGDHVLAYFSEGNPARDMVWDATADFLDAYVNGSDDALDRLRATEGVESAT